MSTSATRLAAGAAVDGPGDHRRSQCARPSSSRAGAPRSTDARQSDPDARRAPWRARRRSAPTADPVMLEIFNNLFMAIAEQMGLALAEHRHLGQHQGAARFLLRPVRRDGRADRQCAAYAGASRLDGRERRTRHRRPARRDGDRCGRATSIVLNAPYNGGTHLPDITVVTPVFDEAERATMRCSSSRARGHHADIGGITPGSMPPDSRTIEEEGVLFDNFAAGRRRPLPRSGDARAARLRAATRRATPTRTSPTSRRRSPPARRASQNCAAWSAHFGLDVVHAYMGHVQDNAEEEVRRVIDRLKDGAFALATMDNGAVDRRCAITRRSTAARAATSISPAPGAAAEQFQRAVRRHAAPPCSMSSARWSTTRSR